MIFKFRRDIMAEKTHLVVEQLKSLISDEQNITANLANASALLNEHLTDINWVGFYLFEKESNQLVLGPFQGKVACIRIDYEKGVCGKAFADNQTVIVENVHEFPGHIACDAASNSEIVIPLHNSTGDKIGVLDIDSPSLGRFNESDQDVLEKFAETLAKQI